MIKRLMATTAVAGALFLPVGAGMASAATTDRPTLDSAKTKCLAAVDRRLTELTALSGRVGASKFVTDPHRSALNGIIDSTRSGLQSLRTKISGDSDAAALRADCTAVVTDYRVYALRRPQVHLVLAADRGAAAIDRAHKVETRLTTAIDKVEAAGGDVTEARAAYSKLQADVDGATTALTGVADKVLTFTPADYNANHELLAPSRASLKTARDDLAAARDDARHVVELLKAEKGKA
jgi:hypothetical protein